MTDIEFDAYMDKLTEEVRDNMPLERDQEAGALIRLIELDDTNLFTGKQMARGITQILDMAAHDNRVSGKHGNERADHMDYPMAESLRPGVQIGDQRGDRGIRTGESRENGKYIPDLLTKK